MRGTKAGIASTRQAPTDTTTRHTPAHASTRQGTHLDGVVEVGLREHQHVLVGLDLGRQAALEAGREGEEPEEHAVHGVLFVGVWEARAQKGGR